MCTGLQEAHLAAPMSLLGLAIACFYKFPNVTLICALHMLARIRHQRGAMLAIVYSPYAHAPPFLILPKWGKTYLYAQSKTAADRSVRTEVKAFHFVSKLPPCATAAQSCEVLQNFTRPVKLNNAHTLVVVDHVPD